MAERAHPEDPGFSGTKYETMLIERYHYCQPYVLGKRVLDVPCGTGWGTSMLNGSQMTIGIDIAVDAVKYGVQHFPSIAYCCGDLQSIPFASNSFDVIICLEGFEHVYRSQAALFLQEAYRLLCENGSLIITVPLLKDGHHSGNPFHLYEYEEKELLSILSPGFITQQFDIIEGPDSTEVRWVGQKRGTKIPPDEIESMSGKKIFLDAEHWVKSLFHGTGFRFSAESPVTLLSTCFGVLTLEGLGKLSGLDARQKEAIIRYLQECQDQETGYFKDPILDRYPVRSSTHNEHYLSLQMTYFSLQALDALESKPTFPLRFIEAYYQENRLSTWLDSLQWTNPWLESNRVMFVMAIMIYQAECHQDKTAGNVFMQGLSWLSSHVDPNTGLWGTDAGASTLNAVAAAYHFIPFFEYTHHAIPGIRKIIDAAISLQQSDGLFGPTIGGGACEDEDVIDLLAVLTQQTDYRKNEIKICLIRAFWAIANFSKSGEGFSYSGRVPAERNAFSSWEAMETDTDQSDAWSTWFRLVALATIKDTYPSDLPPLGMWTYRKWPALGYHRISRQFTERDKETLEQWIGAASFHRGLRLPQTIIPKVSVIIPYYNMGLYLPETLRSIFSQEFTDYEVIILDDGSNDDHSKLLLDYVNDPYIRIIREENRGLAAARNRAIREAKAQYICCIDADDIYEPQFLKKGVDVLDTDPSVGIVTSYYQLFDEQSDQVIIPTCKFPELLIENRAMVSSMFRRDAWEKAGGYDETLVAMQDWEFWISIIEKGYRAEVIPEILFNYRVRAGSMYHSTRKPDRFSSIFRDIVKKHQDTYISWFDQVAQAFARKYAGLSNYTDETRNANKFFQYQLAEQAKAIDDLNRWISEIEQAKTWHIEQLEKCQSAYKEVEAARDWHANQREKWEVSAKQLEEQNAESYQKMLLLEAKNQELMSRVDTLNAENQMLKRYLSKIPGITVIRKIRSILRNSN